MLIAWSVDRDQVQKRSRKRARRRRTIRRLDRPAAPTRLVREEMIPSVQVVTIHLAAAAAVVTIHLAAVATIHLAVVVATPQWKIRLVALTRLGIKRANGLIR